MLVSANWVMDSGKDYVFYFGPFINQACQEWYDDAVRDWYY